MQYELFLVTATDEEVSQVTAILGADGVPLTSWTSTTYFSAPPTPEQITQHQHDTVHEVIQEYRRTGARTNALENAYLTLWNARTQALDEPAIHIQTGRIPASLVTQEPPHAS
jgi:hypothetical protein